MIDDELKYCLYARKSTESDERQALSIESQLSEMKALADKEGLNIVEIKHESKSAKDSSQRIKYNEMLHEIDEGHYNAILTWAPDRLSRNAGDLGTIVDLMDTGKLKTIKTYGQSFSNSPNEKFLLMILCSQAKLENDNKSVNVKRGMRALCQKGVRPGPAPLGYKMVRAERYGDPSKIEIEPESAKFVKEIFGRITKNKFSGRQIWEQLIEEGFRTKNGKNVTLSSIYRIIKTPYYYGEFEYPKGSGIFYKGTHTPLITKAEFELANKLIADNPNPTGKWGRKDFFFSKIMKCGYCGSGISGEEKFKASGKRYVYYKCNKHRSRRNCEGRYVTEEKIVEWCGDLISESRIYEIVLDKKIKTHVQKINDMNKITGNLNNLLTEKDYIKYMLSNGTKFEKREVLKNCGELSMYNNKLEIV